MTPERLAEIEKEYEFANIYQRPSYVPELIERIHHLEDYIAALQEKADLIKIFDDDGSEEHQWIDRYGEWQKVKV